MAFTFGLEFDRYIQATTQLIFSGLTTKISGGRQLWQPHQNLSTVRFIDLLSSSSRRSLSTSALSATVISQTTPIPQRLPFPTPLLT
ncbi:MAG: hypothetical protein ACBR12_05755 [Microcoleus sp.]